MAASYLRYLRFCPLFWQGGFRLKRSRCAGQGVRMLIVKCENDRVSDGRVRYARNGDVRLAYREFGDGDTTLVWIPGWFSESHGARSLSGLGAAI
jgi:hypothetical protein